MSLNFDIQFDLTKNYSLTENTKWERLNQINDKVYLLNYLLFCIKEVNNKIINFR
jgi:hypothetical protein